jgi:hypothetical protein
VQQDEITDAAILLMTLSCGLVRSWWSTDLSLQGTIRQRRGPFAELS